MAGLLQRIGRRLGGGPMQMQMAQQLGLDPAMLEQQAGRNAMMNVFASMAQGGGDGGIGSTVSAFSRGLAGAPGAAQYGYGDAIQQAMMMEQYKEQKAAQEAQKAQQAEMMKLLNDPEFLADMPPQARQLALLSMRAGDYGFLNNAIAASMKGPTERNPTEASLAFAAAAGDQQAAAALKLMREGKGSGPSTSVNVTIPGMDKLLDKSGEAVATRIAGLSEKATGMSEYSNQLDLFNSVMGDLPPTFDWNISAKEFANAFPVVKQFIDDEELGRYQTGRALISEIALGRMPLLKGPASDRDVMFIKSAGPSLMTTQEGRQMLAEISREKAAQYQQINREVNAFAAQAAQNGASINQYEIQQMIDDRIAALPPVSQKFWGQFGFAPAGAFKNVQSGGRSTAPPSPPPGFVPMN